MNRLIQSAKEFKNRHEYDWPMWVGFGPLAWFLDGMMWALGRLDRSGVSGVHQLSIYVIFCVPLILPVAALTMIWLLTVVPAIAIGAIVYSIGCLLAAAIKHFKKEEATCDT